MVYDLSRIWESYVILQAWQCGSFNKHCSVQYVSGQAREGEIAVVTVFRAELSLLIFMLLVHVNTDAFANPCLHGCLARMAVWLPR